MKIFMTGATGYVGTQVAKELIKNNYQVYGLTRSDKSAQKLTDLGGIPIMGTLEDLDTLKKSAQEADAILHLGFTNDFDHFDKATKMDQDAIETMGEAIKGTNKPLIVTAGTAGLDPGVVLTENDLGFPGYDDVSPRQSEQTARRLAKEGVNSATVRFAPSVHGDGRYGLISMMAQMAQKNGAVTYFGNGENRWNAVNYLDAAHLFVLALEYRLKNTGDMRVFNAVGEGEVKMIDIVNTIAKKLDLPTKSLPQPKAGASFDVTQTFGADYPASSVLTQNELNWKPDHIGLLDDLKENL